MNRAKVVLSAVALFAVVGGAFAFKATRALRPFYRVYTETTNPAQRLCTYSTLTTLTTIPQVGQSGVLQTTYYTSPILSTQCPATTVYSIN